MWRWYLSRKKSRQAQITCRHVERILNAQRDLLGQPGIEAVTGAVKELREAAATRAKDNVLSERLTKLETVANKWLKAYPHPSLRENFEVVLVAVAVALGIRTFFLQPFKIPTGSMQPTLYGVNSENLLRRPDIQIPGPITRIKEFFQGVSYVHVRAGNDGELQAVRKPRRLLIFNIYQTLVIGGRPQVIWFPPDYGSKTFEERAEVRVGQTFKRGEEVARFRVTSGDHLFVDRVSYNFRRPKRGEIIVFETRGISGLTQDQYYIKRLVGLGGETLSIGDDRHLRINGQSLDASTAHFEAVYSFDPRVAPQDSQYSGHVHYGYLSTSSNQLKVRPNRYAAMGDNTVNSLDSRIWGDLPQENVIGKSFFVYWPLSSRFGWGTR